MVDRNTIGPFAFPLAHSLKSAAAFEMCLNMQISAARGSAEPFFTDAQKVRSKKREVFHGCCTSHLSFSVLSFRSQLCGHVCRRGKGGGQAGGRSGPVAVAGRVPGTVI